MRQLGRWAGREHTRPGNLTDSVGLYPKSNEKLKVFKQRNTMIKFEILKAHLSAVWRINQRGRRGEKGRESD